MIKFFRIIAIMEGVSNILLLCIFSPIKNFTEFGQNATWDDTAVTLTGWFHGIILIIYILMALIIANHLRWNLKIIFIVFIGSIIPGGTFYVDWKYLR
tara:strand:+ start:446 stop:739 length:294 start_codon:yes stop_codon:yes gene_type:complete